MERTLDLIKNPDGTYNVKTNLISENALIHNLPIDDDSDIENFEVDPNDENAYIYNEVPDYFKNPNTWLPKNTPEEKIDELNEKISFLEIEYETLKNEYSSFVNELKEPTQRDLNTFKEYEEHLRLRAEQLDSATRERNKIEDNLYLENLKNEPKPKPRVSKQQELLEKFNNSDHKNPNDINTSGKVIFSEFYNYYEKENYVYTAPAPVNTEAQLMLSSIVPNLTPEVDEEYQEAIWSALRKSSWFSNLDKNYLNFFDAEVPKHLTELNNPKFGMSDSMAEFRIAFDQYYIDTFGDRRENQENEFSGIVDWDDQYTDLERTYMFKDESELDNGIRFRDDNTMYVDFDKIQKLTREALALLDYPKFEGLTHEQLSKRIAFEGNVVNLYRVRNFAWMKQNPKQNFFKNPDGTFNKFFTPENFRYFDILANDIFGISIPPDIQDYHIHINLWEIERQKRFDKINEEWKEKYHDPENPFGYLHNAPGGSTSDAWLKAMLKMKFGSPRQKEEGYDFIRANEDDFYEDYIEMALEVQGTDEDSEFFKILREQKYKMEFKTLEKSKSEEEYLFRAHHQLNLTYDHRLVFLTGKQWWGKNCIVTSKDLFGPNRFKCDNKEINDLQKSFLDAGTWDDEHKEIIDRMILNKYPGAIFHPFDYDNYPRDFPKDGEKIPKYFRKVTMTEIEQLEQDFVAEYVEYEKKLKELKEEFKQTRAKYEELGVDTKICIKVVKKIKKEFKLNDKEMENHERIETLIKANSDVMSLLEILN